MAVSGEHRPLDGSLPHELTSKTPFPSLKLYFLIGILSLSALSIALLIYLCIRLSRTWTSKKRKTLAKETILRASSGPSYEVFLSFRGPDTRHEFTDCLYHAMIDAGILVFRDDESLRVGERISDELLQAIENSKIYIPIFSKNYAASHWCLQELAYMIDCTSKSNENKKILPIFLDVEPDDVKLKTNLYSKALSKHRKRFSAEAVESWKKALIEVDEIKGWNLKKDHGQGDLIGSVIRMVLVKLKVAYENVTEHLVGVDDRVEAIIKMLDVGSDGVRFLVIHGMGGVGKTTLAKVIFNKLSSSFDQCCFLADVRESSEGNDGPVNLQKQLLSKLLGPHFVDEIRHVNDGINKLDGGVLRNKKVLIILDDVDKKKQLNSLAQKGDWFDSGSRIIITTRNKGVLSEGLDVLTYEASEMEFDHALKLFSKHAFRRDYPPDHRVSLSKKIVHTLGKLPLALEITGSSVNGKSEKYWIDTWEKLKEAPPLEVQRKLMISYERLENTEKEIFLDIACFFVNNHKTYPFYMWDACKYHPHVAIDVLILMSLIKIKDNKTFWMHDQVRDLGREIIRQENFQDACKRSRLWEREEVLSVLKEKEGSGKTKALSLRAGDTFHHEEILTHDVFADLRGLRFFLGESVSLVGDFNNLLSKLRWLSWHSQHFWHSGHSNSKFETTNFHPIELVILDLSRSYISEKWIGWDQIRKASKLKVLDLSYCENLKRTPDLFAWVSLERLILKGCCNLIEIDPSIVKLKHLTTLNLNGCKSLRELPVEIGCLQALTDFVMSNTLISRLPTTVSHLSNLQTLKLENCPKLKQLPELPPSLTCLSLALEERFDWEHSDSEEYEQETLVTPLPTSIGTLSQLKTLTLSCKNVQFLPQLPSSLRELRLRDLATTRSPDFSNLKNLSILTFYQCSLEFSSIFDAESEELRMERCRLRKLDAPLQLEMKRLRLLTMDECESLPEVLDLSRMKNLYKVSLKDCLSLVELRGLEELGSLYSLSVHCCPSMERMSDLSKLKELRELVVVYCFKLKSVQGLNYLESLKKRIIFDNGEFGG